MQLRATLKGDDILIRKLNPPRLIGPPSRTLMRSFGEIARDLTREEAPVDTERLRGSIDFEIGGGAVSEWMRVGTNLDYAPFVHNPTRPHFPPIAAVAPWANRHGIPPFLVARAISLRGTRGNPFLRRGIERSRVRLGHLMTVMARNIEKQFGSG